MMKPFHLLRRVESIVAFYCSYNTLFVLCNILLPNVAEKEDSKTALERRYMPPKQGTVLFKMFYKIFLIYPFSCLVSKVCHQQGVRLI